MFHNRILSDFNMYFKPRIFKI